MIHNIKKIIQQNGVLVDCSRNVLSLWSLTYERATMTLTGAGAVGFTWGDEFKVCSTTPAPRGLYRHQYWMDDCDDGRPQ